MFSYPSLLWFLPLLGLVILIHLINMFRHRPVEWAAIEFLLASYRKSRARILLQQLLLLILRTLAVATVIFMLAKPILQSSWADWFAGKSVHHIVLLDDSYSMNDRDLAHDGPTLFETALELVKRIGEGVRPDADDRFSLIRLSRCQADQAEMSIHEITLDDNGKSILNNTLEKFKPSQSGADPERLLARALDIRHQSASRFKPIVYFISDFRTKDWSNPSAIQTRLEELKQSGCLVRMIRASDEQHSNLGITDLRPLAGIRAANVDLLLDATVVNHGTSDVENVQITVLLNEQIQTNLIIPQLKAGEQTVPPIRFHVRPEREGSQKIELQLQADAISDDNYRYLVLDVPKTLNVLLIVPAGESDQKARYLRVALSPGGTNSGIQVRMESPDFLSKESLKDFSAIFLTETIPLDRSAVDALEKYISEGGGLAMFFGPESVEPGRLEQIRQSLFKEGQGLLPCDPTEVKILEPDYLTRAPDLKVQMDHPIFRLFADGQGTLLESIKIEHYLAVRPDSITGDILATLRTGEPFVIESRFGKGNIVTFLSSAAPDWNNWARGNPSFVVVLLELVARLSPYSQTSGSLHVSETMTIETDPTICLPEVRIVPPENNARETNEAKTIPLQLMDQQLAQGLYHSTSNAGFYQLGFKQHSGDEIQQTMAVNVDVAEGNTALAEISMIVDQLKPLNITLDSVAGFSSTMDFSSDSQHSDLILLFLILLLMAESFLAGRMLPPMRQK